MKDPESAESKKNQISDFYFWSYGHFCSKNCQFSMNFNDNLKNKNREIVLFIRFSTLRIIHENGSKPEGGGSAYLYLGQG